MTAHPAAAGAADAAALLARAARNDVAGAQAMVDEITRGDSVRECLLALAFLAGGFAAASADLRGASIDESIANAAQVAVEAIAAIENREDPPCE